MTAYSELQLRLIAARHAKNARSQSSSTVVEGTTERPNFQRWAAAQQRAEYDRLYPPPEPTLGETNPWIHLADPHFQILLTLYQNSPENYRTYMKTPEQEIAVQRWAEQHWPAEQEKRVREWNTKRNIEWAAEQKAQQEKDAVSVPTSETMVEQSDIHQQAAAAQRVEYDCLHPPPAPTLGETNPSFHLADPYFQILLTLYKYSPDIYKNYMKTPEQEVALKIWTDQQWSPAIQQRDKEWNEKRNIEWAAEQKARRDKESSPPLQELSSNQPLVPAPGDNSITLDNPSCSPEGKQNHSNHDLSIVDITHQS